MSSMDLVAALRHPTMGETSGVVVDALSLGIPVIVNKTGSYKELPRFVKKLDIDHIREDLSAYLLKLIEDPAYLAHLKKRAYEYTSAHDFCSLSKRYYQALLHEID
jgi:glycosyltransferase involved in cell wall biosynthesis